MFGSAGLGTIGAIVGICGLIIAIRSDNLAHDIQAEARAVDLTLSATVNQRDFTDEGLGLRVSVVNASLRPVIITRGSFWMDRCKVGDLIGWIPSLGVFDRHQIDPGALTDTRRDLPITVNSREGTTFALLVDAWTPCVSRISYTRSGLAAVRAARQKLEASVAQLPPYTNRPPLFRLTAYIVPGGVRHFIVRIQPGMTPRFDWQTSLIVRKRIPIGVTLRRKLGARGEVDVVNLDVWSRFSTYHASAARPIMGDEPTFFPLSGLGRGAFSYAFRLGSRTLTAGVFRNPAPCSAPYYIEPPCPSSAAVP